MNDIDFDHLNKEQRQVCDSDCNFILSACPGSGKTKTITYRLAALQNRYENSHKLNIAITYTNRAADEIKERLEKMGIDLSNIWVGTIHSFCLRFILRPYSMYNPFLSHGFRIIDSYTSERYIYDIASELGFQFDYSHPRALLENEEAVCNAYYAQLQKNHEIDFDMILTESYSLIEKHRFICEDLAYTIRSIHVDEFQDTTIMQYKILSQIVKMNRSINILFAGDRNQAIYRSLGGIALSDDDIRTMFEVPFISASLTGCYRSTQRIVDFYRNFEVDTIKTKSVAKYRDELGTIAFNQKLCLSDLSGYISKIIINQLNNGIKESEICVVAPRWYSIFPAVSDLRANLTGVKFDAPECSPFKVNSMDPFYMLTRLLFSPSGVRSRTRKSISIEFLSTLRDCYQVSLTEDMDYLSFLYIINSIPKLSSNGILHFSTAVNLVFSKLGVDVNEYPLLRKAFTDFVDESRRRIDKNKLSELYEDFFYPFREKDGIVINTLHGIKGEEYDTVIAFDLLKFDLPHRSYYFDSNLQAIRTEEVHKLLYVLCSRAKKHLFLLSEIGRRTKKGKLYVPTEELSDVHFDYDFFQP